MLADPGMRALLRDTLTAQMKRHDVECLCCGYTGKFYSAGIPARPNASCPRCVSYERHRLMALALQRGFISFAGKDVLHFAPEPIIKAMTDKQSPRYRVTADLAEGRADRVLNIEQLDLGDETFDIIICSHVLEHVDDRKALAEMKRVLRPGGQIVIMIPIIEGWETSYENPEIASEVDRDIHFGQFDHVRYYGGADFRKRVRDAGFQLSEFTADGAECVRYALMRGERIFLATK
jgi:SAM-dependent methyltransferase